MFSVVLLSLEDTHVSNITDLNFHRIIFHFLLFLRGNIVTRLGLCVFVPQRYAIVVIYTVFLP